MEGWTTRDRVSPVAGRGLGPALGGGLGGHDEDRVLAPLGLVQLHQLGVLRGLALHLTGVSRVRTTVRTLLRRALTSCFGGSFVHTGPAVESNE